MEKGECYSDTNCDKIAGNILATIRTHYLQARPPQQIKELANLFQKKSESESVATSTKNQVDLSIRENSNFEGPDINEGDSPNSSEEIQGDLGRVGIMTGKDENLCSTEMEGNTMKEVTPGSARNPDEDAFLHVMQKLHIVTVGFSPEAGGKEEFGVDEGISKSKCFHPPVQYRISFAKHVIKQMESAGKCSTPQGGHAEDIEDPAEQEALLLEKWYDTLEQLLSSGQVLSEPFYRLYEIKLPAHHHNKGESRQEIVKIFENETSFVADGTTGLVTWKAAIEFAKWLSSNVNGSGKSDSEKEGEGGALENCKWILELGCGCGFLAVVVTKYFDLTLKQYIATDGSLAALEKAKENVETNFSQNNNDKLLKSKIRFEKVEWQNDRTKESFSNLVDGLTSIYGAESGILLGTDIVFDPQLIPEIVELICDFVEGRSGKVLIACTIRNPETMKTLKTHLESMALKIKICGQWEDGEILEIMR